MRPTSCPLHDYSDNALNPQFLTQQSNIRIITREEWDAEPYSASDSCYDYTKNPLFSSELKNSNEGEILKNIYRGGRIVVHHTAGQMGGPLRIEESQRQIGYDLIAYHFVVDSEGNIYEGRPLTILGAHAGVPPSKANGERVNAQCVDGSLETNFSMDYDYRSIGVVLDGSFESAHKKGRPDPDNEKIPIHKDHPQFLALEQLLIHLIEMFEISEVSAHRHVRFGGTLCPGQYLINLLNKSPSANINSPFRGTHRDPPLPNIEPRFICHSKSENCAKKREK